MQALEPILLNVNNINRFLVQRKKFGVAQNILRPVKGQGICLPTLHADRILITYAPVFDEKVEVACKTLILWEI